MNIIEPNYLSISTATEEKAIIEAREKVLVRKDAYVTFAKKYLKEKDKLNLFLSIDIPAGLLTIIVAFVFFCIKNFQITTKSEIITTIILLVLFAISVVFMVILNIEEGSNTDSNGSIPTILQEFRDLGYVKKYGYITDEEAVKEFLSGDLSSFVFKYDHLARQLYKFEKVKSDKGIELVLTEINKLENYMLFDVLVNGIKAEELRLEYPDTLEEFACLTKQEQDGKPLYDFTFIDRYFDRK